MDAADEPDSNNTTFKQITGGDGNEALDDSDADVPPPVAPVPKKLAGLRRSRCVEGLGRASGGHCLACWTPDLGNLRVVHRDILQVEYERPQVFEGDAGGVACRASISGPAVWLSCFGRGR